MTSKMINKLMSIQYAKGYTIDTEIGLSDHVEYQESNFVSHEV